MLNEQIDVVSPDGTLGKWLRVFLCIFFGIMILTFGAFLPIYLYFLMTTSTDPIAIATNPIMGVFISFFIATFVVLFLRYTAGPIEFEGLGFRFKGASGQVVLWALVFLVLMVGISTLGAFA